ncbi:hypothetical protein Cob_v001266 [Colletotrichum orbiculare MAFF 240422]|uniref:Rhodopsin domain-containing protein n=1 Tax=Colletotrichum orbiculare (strain 104-T / ATCC 96160 / CBS 514.97 / LARS 414 / MAFF 240422) TaxID=1213857 RepID=N4W5K6_COLOR|nr:hypothetical protein Cob_v001266 [Colletotrichum orbiculare MAFF 240422]
MFGNLSRSGEFPSHYTDEGLPAANRKSTIIAVIASFMVLAWFCVGLRLYVRFRVMRAPGWDDLVVVMALLTGSASGIGLSLTTNYGMGHLLKDVPDSDREMFFMLFYISNASFTMSNALVKLSMLLQYLRVFKDRMPFLRRISKFMAVIVTVWGLAFSFAAWVPCFPVYQFYRIGSESNCYGYGSTDSSDVYAIVIASNASNMALDFLILVLPIPLLFSTNTIRKTRAGLVGLFCLGTLINVVAAWRLVANRATSNDQPDPTSSFPLIIVLGETENRLSLMLASIPVFWPVVTQSWHNIIFVTHEVKVESTRHLPMMQPWSENPEDPGFRDPPTNEEQERLRPPGRMPHVNRHIRGLISPFAEGQTAPVIPPEAQYRLSVALEGCDLNFETVPEMARSTGSGGSRETQR